jgi:hypothetical protein
MIQEFKVNILLLVSKLNKVWDSSRHRVNIHLQNRIIKIMQVTTKVMGTNSSRISKGSFRDKEVSHLKINMEALDSKDFHHHLNMEAHRILECHRVNSISHRSLEVNLNGEGQMQTSNSNLHQWVNLKDLVVKEDSPIHHQITFHLTSITSLQTGLHKSSKSVRVRWMLQDYHLTCFLQESNRAKYHRRLQKIQIPKSILQAILKSLTNL